MLGPELSLTWGRRGWKEVANDAYIRVLIFPLQNLAALVGFSMCCLTYIRYTAKCALLYAAKLTTVKPADCSCLQR
jgi:hypothetical protein